MLNHHAPPYQLGEPVLEPLQVPLVLQEGVGVLAGLGEGVLPLVHAPHVQPVPRVHVELVPVEHVAPR